MRKRVEFGGGISYNVEVLIRILDAVCMDHVSIAQWIEQKLPKLCVEGSSPPRYIL